MSNSIECWMLNGPFYYNAKFVSFKLYWLSQSDQILMMACGPMFSQSEFLTHTIITCLMLSHHGCQMYPKCVQRLRNVIPFHTITNHRQLVRTFSFFKLDFSFISFQLIGVTQYNRRCNRMAFDIFCYSFFFVPYYVNSREKEVYARNGNGRTIINSSRKKIVLNQPVKYFTKMKSNFRFLLVFDYISLFFFFFCFSMSVSISFIRSFVYLFSISLMYV